MAHSEFVKIWLEEDRERQVDGKTKKKYKRLVDKIPSARMELFEDTKEGKEVDNFLSNIVKEAANDQDQDLEEEKEEELVAESTDYEDDGSDDDSDDDDSPHVTLPTTFAV